ncbi:MAG: hemolysin III family protein [Opitutales bacterium]|nr:hemolysin III family protein [Opitutales bacterium]
MKRDIRSQTCEESALVPEAALCSAGRGKVTRSEGKHDVHPTSGYSAIEEVMNSVTHALGLVWAITALVLSVVFASLHSDAWIIVACAVHGASLILLYLSSFLYHTMRTIKWKKFFLTWDHACIYVLIAGSYTPFTFGPLRGTTGWIIFGIVWALAIAGVVKEIFASKRGGLVGSLIYLGMGWICLFAIVPLYFNMTTAGFTLLLVGGVVYSAGVFFYLYRRMKYHHAVWHLFVLGGSVCQWVAVLTIIFAGK